MDIDMKNWASQPDVCRCCLSTIGTWDLLAAYITDAGEKTIYSEILRSCFGISLSFLSEWGPGRLACDACVIRLRDAHSFRNQVASAEEHFVIYVNRKHETIDETAKCGIVSNAVEQTEGATVDCESEKTTSNDNNEWMSNTEPLKILSNSHTTNKRKDVHDVKDSELFSEDCDYARDEDNTVYVAVNVPELSRPPIKQVSERKRIRITCETVLRDSTACPFRHHKSWFQCFFCAQTFMEIPALRAHTLQSHGDLTDEIRKLKRYPRSLQIDITELKCRYCDINLIDVETMRVHFKDMHNQIIYKECIADYKVDSSPYTCHICGKQFHVFRTLTTHLNEHYANFICDVCGKSFINSKRLKVHNRTHERGAFPCAECGKVLKTKASQANHTESHSKRVIRCQICSMPMKHYNDRIKHMSEEHDITHKFKCPICPREYNIKHYLATHIRQTHGHKNKKCLECGMAFITNHGLKKHVQKHSGVKAFSCGVCDKAYARSYTLKEHMRVHDK